MNYLSEMHQKSSFPPPNEYGRCANSQRSVEHISCIGVGVFFVLFCWETLVIIGRHSSINSLNFKCKILFE